MKFIIFGVDDTTRYLFLYNTPNFMTLTFKDLREQDRKKIQTIVNSYVETQKENKKLKEQLELQEDLHTKQMAKMSTTIRQLQLQLEKQTKDQQKLTQSVAQMQQSVVVQRAEKETKAMQTNEFQAKKIIKKGEASIQTTEPDKQPASIQTEMITSLSPPPKKTLYEQIRTNDQSEGIESLSTIDPPQETQKNITKKYLNQSQQNQQSDANIQTTQHVQRVTIQSPVQNKSVSQLAPSQSIQSTQITSLHPPLISPPRLDMRVDIVSEINRSLREFDQSFHENNQSPVQMNQRQIENLLARDVAPVMKQLQKPTTPPPREFVQIRSDIQSPQQQSLQQSLQKFEAQTQMDQVIFTAETDVLPHPDSKPMQKQSLMDPSLAEQMHNVFATVNESLQRPSVTYMPESVLPPPSTVGKQITPSQLNPSSTTRVKQHFEDDVDISELKTFKTVRPLSVGPNQKRSTSPADQQQYYQVNQQEETDKFGAETGETTVKFENTNTQRSEKLDPAYLNSLRKPQQFKPRVAQGSGIAASVQKQSEMSSSVSLEEQYQKLISSKYAETDDLTVTQPRLAGEIETKKLDEIRIQKLRRTVAKIDDKELDGLLDMLGSRGVK